MEVIGEAELE